MAANFAKKEKGHVSCSTSNADSDQSSLASPALTWSISRQANSVLITLASSSNSATKQLHDPDFWQQFIDTYQHGLADKLLLNSAFTFNQLAGQLRFITTQSDTSSVEIDGRMADIISATSAMKDNVPLLLAVYFAPEMKQLPSSHWLDSCFASTEAIPVDQRYKWLLAGRPATGYIDPGPLVCSCMAVGKNIIINAITNEQCHSAQAVGNACRAGTNCGSCIGQINELIAQYAPLTQT